MDLRDLALFVYDSCSWAIMECSAIQTVDEILTGTMTRNQAILFGVLEAILLVVMWKIYRYFRRKIVSF